MTETDTTDNIVEIVCILDRSGSMGSVLDDSIGGFNAFLAEQKKLPGRANMTLVLFDNEYQEAVTSQDIANVAPLTRETYVPRGSTALYDAIGRAIGNVTEKIAKTPKTDRPTKVIVAILTDGQENSSREFQQKQVFDLVSAKREEDKWEFVYLGANQDAMTAGHSIGVAVSNSFNYNSTGVGTVRAYGAVGKLASKFRATPAGATFTAADLDETRGMLEEPEV